MAADPSVRIMEALIFIVAIGFLVYHLICHPIQSMKFVGGAFGLVFLGVMGIIGLILLVVALGAMGF